MNANSFLSDPALKQLVQQTLGTYQGPKRNAIVTGFNSDGFTEVGRFAFDKDGNFQLQEAVQKPWGGGWRIGLGGAFYF